MIRGSVKVKVFRGSRRLVRCFGVTTNEDFKFKVFPPALPVFSVTQTGEWPLICTDIDGMKDNVMAGQSRFTTKTWTDILRFRLGFTSNRIDGNTFTEAQVMTFLKTGVTVGGKTLREHFEIESHDHALKFILESAKSPITTVATVDFVCNLHRICMPAPRVYCDDPIPGELKKEENMISCNIGGETVVRQLVPPSETHQQLFDMLKWCEANENKMHILPFLSIMHYNFVRIHPFADTNGRTSRLLIVFFMLRHKYPPLIIEPSRREEYMAALTHADLEQDLQPLMKFLAECMVSTYSTLTHLYG